MTGNKETDSTILSSRHPSSNIYKETRLTLFDIHLENNIDLFLRFAEPEHNFGKTKDASITIFL